MESIDVEGATGNVHTNYDGKANAAIDAFKNGAELVYVHVEGPDECGHRAETDNKVKSIELIDKKILAPVYEYLGESDTSTDTDREFICSCTALGAVAHGKGKSKKEARAEAAREILKKNKDV